MKVDDLVNGLEDKLGVGGGIDYITTYSVIDILERIGTVVLTLFLVYMSIIVPLVIITEVLYVVFPLFRDIVDKLEVNFKGNGFVQNIYKLSLSDAKKAVEEANTKDTGRSSISTYMRIKIGWIFLSSIAMYLLVLGVPRAIAIVQSLLGKLLELVSRI